MSERDVIICFLITIYPTMFKCYCGTKCKKLGNWRQLSIPNSISESQQQTVTDPEEEG